MIQPKAAAELIECVKLAGAELRSQDLLILVFSGRGVEIGGRRYLALSHAAPTPTVLARPALSSNAQNIVWQSEGLIDLGDLASAVAGHWFVGIYDTQFTQPALDPDRSDQLLDKHIDSVRPRFRNTAESRVEERALAKGTVEAVPRPRGKLPPRQVHVWLEGRLNQHATPPHPCVADLPNAYAVASPLAAAVHRTVPEQKVGTYRDWLNELANDNCLRQTGERVDVVFQGDLDVPLLASGDGAEFVDYFHDGIARDDLNLCVALELAKDVATRFPTARNKLARAALLVALAQLHGADAELHGFLEDRADWLTEADNLLTRMSLSEFMQGAASEAERKAAMDLWAIRLELLSRTYEIKDRNDEGALRVLREADPDAILGQRDLEQRLVRLSQEFLQRDPGIILNFAREKLRKLIPEGGNPSAAAANLDALIRTARARQAEPYQIALPDPKSADSVR